MHKGGEGMIDPQEQRRIMGHFATGVTVVTARAGERVSAMPASAVASLSLHPPLVLVAVGRQASMHAALMEARGFALNILDESQEALSRRFARSGPKDLADVETTTAVTGAPVFRDALAWVDCRLAEIHRGGDHDLFLGEIVAGGAREGRPLLYFRGSYGRLAD